MRMWRKGPEGLVRGVQWDGGMEVGRGREELCSKGGINGMRRKEKGREESVHKLVPLSLSISFPVFHLKLYQQRSMPSTSQISTKYVSFILQYAHIEHTAAN